MILEGNPRDMGRKQAKGRNIQVIKDYEDIFLEELYH